jgi:hypothetical protein
MKGQPEHAPPAETALNLIVVVDSCIWLAQQMLRHSAGSALRFFLRTRGAKVAVPEVVRKEVVQHLGRDLLELSVSMRRDYARMLPLVGALKELVLPGDAELLELAEKAFENTRLDLLDVPFCLDSARSSFEKCLRGEAPSGPKNQQFKDGVLWADCVRLACDAPVMLVTQDAGFYEGRDFRKGLAPNLRAEAATTQHGIRISHELSAVLEQVEGPVPIDYDTLATKFMPMTLEAMRARRAHGRNAYALCHRRSCRSASGVRAPLPGNPPG